MLWPPPNRIVRRVDETDNMLYSFVLTVPPDSPNWTLADILGAIEAAGGQMQRGATIGRASGTRPELGRVRWALLTKAEAVDPGSRAWLNSTAVTPRGE
jgi:hypothetical protein